MESIGESNTTIGIISKGGIIIANEKKEALESFGEKSDADRTFIIDNHIICTASGAIPDSQILVEHARIQAQHYKKIYQDFIPVQKIVEIICDIKQEFTQKGGQRPFGVSFLIAGWDSSNGLQLFRTDPSGTFSGWKAVAIGANNITNQNILVEEYQENLELNEGLGIIVKILHKKTNSSEFGKILDVILLALDDKQRVLIRKMKKDEINSLVS